MKLLLCIFILFCPIYLINLINHCPNCKEEFCPEFNLFKVNSQTQQTPKQTQNSSYYCTIITFQFKLSFQIQKLILHYFNHQ